MEKALENEERILVCLSSSPSNQKVIAAAAKMAGGFNAALNAIYIKPTDYDRLPEEDKLRLQNNIRFAEECGASVTTIIGNDIPVQIAEYAHVSGTTKIVVGRSGVKRQHFWSKATITEQIILYASDVDVYIIPDSSVDLKRRNERINRDSFIRPSWRDTLITLFLLLISSAVGLVFTRFGFSEANIITVFILGVLIISVTTSSPIYSAAGSLSSVLLFNYLFIEPRFSFHTYATEYAVTFAIMLIASLITGSLANRLKANARQAALEAIRTKVLLDTNQLLQKAKSPEDALKITARQVITLLDHDVVIYPLSEGEKPGSGIRFNRDPYETEICKADSNEEEIAAWVYEHQQIAGSRTDHFRDAYSLYHPICMNGYCYGVIGIYLERKPLESFEYSVFMSILGECALSLENLRNAAEKEQAAVVAQNEKLRSNLLRSISHDIRTPLTSISGNASTLMSLYQQLDEETLTQIFPDLYDDSEWLIGLVENLLSISRIENGQIDLHLSTEVIGDVIEEALQHVDRNSVLHHIYVDQDDDLLLARMDSRLIMQVLINLINNAIKNTQNGSNICIKSEQMGEMILVSVTDNGPGIPEEMKPHLFEMFYTGRNIIADGRRGIGLGLALCKAIIEAHGGSITLTDNSPSGCCFTFTLPREEVKINE